MSVENENQGAQADVELFSKEELGDWNRRYTEANASGGVGQCHDELFEALGERFTGDDLTLDECEAFFNDAISGEGEGEGSSVKDRALTAGLMLGAAKAITRKRGMKEADQARLSKMEEVYKPLKGALPKKFSATRFETFWKAWRAGDRAARNKELPEAGFAELNRMMFRLGRYLRLKLLGEKDPTMENALARMKEKMGKKEGGFPGVESEKGVESGKGAIIERNDGAVAKMAA
ncbi:MAG: hypothetical protein V1746_06565 [bacterium]